MKSKLEDIWNKVPVDYYQKGIKNNLFQKIWHSIKINSAKNSLRDYKFKNCLDIGCASGYMLSEIARVYPEANYVGVDVYDKAVAYAKQRYPHIEFIISSTERLPFKDRTFDLILCHETIEHVKNPTLVLKEIKRILKKDARCILVMDSGSVLFRLVWLIWENTTGKVWKGAHIHPFHHSELEKLIKKAGLKIERRLFTHLGMEVTFILQK